MSARLLICTPTHSLHGGVERILESLADGLPRHGFEVVFGLARGACFHDPDRFRAEFPRLQSLDIDGTSGRAPDRIRALRRIIERVDPDLVLMARLFDVYPAAAELKLRGHRLRLAVTIQAYEPEYLADAVRYAPFIDLCVTSGTLVASSAAHFTRLPPARIVSIPGGVALPLRRREPHPSQPLRLGYVGRIETLQKRALDLADLLTELRARGIAFTCEVVGSGSAEDDLRRRIGNMATTHGWLSTRELYERIYPELDVVLHFAEFEGITIAPREAMAHGVVPVVSRFTGLKTESQFIEGVNALTFPVGDIARAADAVERLDRDRPLLERLSGAAAESQQGIRSEEGALEAWSEALHRAAALPRRVGTSEPRWPRERGRLDILPSSLADALRRLRGQVMIHNDPGSEWPHCGPAADPELIAAIREYARNAE